MYNAEKDSALTNALEMGDNVLKVSPSTQWSLALAYSAHLSPFVPVPGLELVLVLFLSLAAVRLSHRGGSALSLIKI